LIEAGGEEKGGVLLPSQGISMSMALSVLGQEQVKPVSVPVVMA